MLCTRCDTRNDEGARFCRFCGAAFTMSAAQPSYTFTTAPMTGPTCPTCTGANPAGARFCVYCAAALDRPAQPTYTAPRLQPAMAQSAVANVTVQYVMPQPVQFVVTDLSNLLIRAIWFLLIGWWLSFLWTIGAWLFNLTLIGLPVGLMMLHALPQVTTLRPRTKRPPTYPHAPVQQHPLALRAIWFLLIGWWASLVWSIVAWALSLTWLLLPISFWMWNRVPTITTLAAE